MLKHVSIFFAVLVLGLIASTSIAAPVYIYKDANYKGNKGVWGNIMPPRAADIDSVRFKTAVKPDFDGKGTAVQVSFDLTKPPHWAGLVVPVQQDYWGEWQAEGLDLSRVQKLVFWARGEKGGEQIQIKAFIANDKEFGDSADMPISSDWLTLTKDWQKYEIAIEDSSQLKRVITPFAIIANEAHNADPKIVIYVDEIYYE